MFNSFLLNVSVLMLFFYHNIVISMKKKVFDQIVNVLLKFICKVFLELN
jgi:hypothetical protein